MRFEGPECRFEASRLEFRICKSSSAHAIRRRVEERGVIEYDRSDGSRSENDGQICRRARCDNRTTLQKLEKKRQRTYLILKALNRMGLARRVKRKGSRRATWTATEALCTEIGEISYKAQPQPVKARINVPPVGKISEANVGYGFALEILSNNRAWSVQWTRDAIDYILQKKSDQAAQASA
jgi:hypothetical protein